MCTLVFAWQVFAETPIAVAANRDERTHRQSSPPAVRGDEPAVLAPRDEQAGGTWMGVNEHRVLVGITNRWLEAEIDPTRSRGLLVEEVLVTQSAAAGVGTVRNAVERESYDGFNLLIADRDEAWLLEYDGHLASRKFDPGVHVVVNTGADGQYAIPADRAAVAKTQGENADRVRSEMEPDPGETAEEWVRRGKSVLGNHEFGVCIHGDGYGTVSTSLVTIGVDGEIGYRYADGPPCTTATRVVDNHI